jgi:hypothetical protein
MLERQNTLDTQINFFTTDLFEDENLDDLHFISLKKLLDSCSLEDETGHILA